MKAILYCSMIVMLFSSCHKEKVIDQNVQNSVNLLLNVESTLEKIPSSQRYRGLKTVFNTDENKIFLSYGDLNKDFNERIDTLHSLKYLSRIELEELKSNIIKLSTIGLSNQDYIMYDPDLRKGIYIYRYKYEDWMADELQMINYIALDKNIDKRNKWFNNTFKIVTQKGSVVILTKNDG